MNKEYAVQAVGTEVRQVLMPQGFTPKTEYALRLELKHVRNSHTVLVLDRNMATIMRDYLTRALEGAE